MNPLDRSRNFTETLQAASRAICRSDSSMPKTNRPLPAPYHKSPFIPRRNQGSGELPFVRIGKRILSDIKDFDRFIEMN